MAYLDNYYLNVHKTQFDGTYYEAENCTPTSGANGLAAISKGRINRSGGGVRTFVKRWEETNPATPGWSLEDLKLAVSRIDRMYDLKVTFIVKSGTGWGWLINYLNSGHYVVLQGDSDRFSNNTCSGKFNGDHAIGIHPARTRASNGYYLRWINDPICKTGRWEYEYVIKSYGQKLNYNLRYGVFTPSVPMYVPDTDVDFTTPPPASLGTPPPGTASWVQAVSLDRLWEMDDRGICRPFLNASAPTKGFTFIAYAGPNISEWWAPGPLAPKDSDKAVFRKILGPVHKGNYIRVTDQGCTWHHKV